MESTQTLYKGYSVLLETVLLVDSLKRSILISMWTLLNANIFTHLKLLYVQLYE